MVISFSEYLLEMDRLKTGWSLKDVKSPNKVMTPMLWRRWSFAVDNRDFDTVTLPIRKIFATQHTVNPDYLKSLGKSDLPVVLKVSGDYYLMDGHHRVVAQADNGKQTVKVHLVDLDEKPLAHPELF